MISWVDESTAENVASDFEGDFRKFADRSPVKNSTLPQEFFAWDLIVDYLLTEMSDWDEKDSLGRTVLHRLIQVGNHERAALLLELMPDTDVNACDAEGRTPLDYAVLLGCPRSVQLLLENNATVSASNQQSAIICHLNDSLPLLFADISETLLNSHVYVDAAVMANNLIALQFLVERFYYSTHEHLRNDHLSSCLILVAHFNHFRILQYLASLPCVEYLTNNTSNALTHAIQKRNWKAAKLLLNLGASPIWVDPNGMRSLSTAFQLAVAADSVRMVRMMGSVDRSIYQDGRLIHPMETAVGKNSTRMIQYLEKIGFSLLDTARCLLAAVKHDNSDIVQRVYGKIDESIVAGSEGSLLSSVKEQLNRWKAKAYLEESDSDSYTVFARAVELAKFDMIEPFLKKCKEVRWNGSVGLDSFITYRKNRISHVYQCDNVSQNTSLLHECDELLTLLNDCSKKRCEESTITLSNGKVTASVIYNVLSDDDRPDIKNTIELDEEIEVTDEVIYEAILNELHVYMTTCGCFKREPDHSPTYFVKRGESAYFLSTVNELPLNPLKTLVNFGSSVGETAFHRICYQTNRLDLVKLMLENGADPLAMNTVNMAPLHIALISSDTMTALHLLQYCVDRDLKSSSGTPVIELCSGQGLRPLHLAAMSGKLQVIEYLIECNVDLRSQDSLGVVSVIHALPTRQIAILKLLLKHDPELLNIPDDNGHTLVHHSAKREDPTLIRLLLQYDNLDLYRKDKKGVDPTSVAIEFKNTSWIEAVFNFAKSKGITGLTKTISAQGLQPLHYVLLYKDVALQKLIVEHEIDAELSEMMPKEALQKLKDVLVSKSFGMTALHLAIKVGWQESIEFILRCQELCNTQSDDKLNLVSEQFDAHGSSPLDYVLDSNNEKLINIFLQT